MHRYALAVYKAYFITVRGWIEAAEAIGLTLGRDERTIRNIIADYKRVAGLPDSVIVAAEAVGIDLVERKHTPLVDSIESELAANDVPSLPEAQQILGRVLEMPAPGAPQVKLDRSEKIRWSIRMKIRTALNNAIEFTDQVKGELAFSQGIWRWWNGSIWIKDDRGKRRALVPNIANVYLSDIDKLKGFFRIGYWVSTKRQRNGGIL